ncbi:MAG: hypothetical protein JO087_02230 [Actinobacteria bacterium]|nr:hypothetical protein [Actinomycetota bacterium]
MTTSTLMPADRRSPATSSRLGSLVALGLLGVWVWVWAHIVSHAVYVSHDSMISYAHVWYISHHLIPLHMPVLGHGQAFAYPYGFVPWTTAALLRPFVGDRIVSIWFVVGAVGALAATYWSFPETRRGWWAAAVLANPALVAGVLIGQQPFLWASALALLAVGMWRRGWRAWATVVMGLAQATHPAIVLPLAAVLVAGVAVVDKEQRRTLVRHYAVSLVIAAPAVWLVVASPVVADTSVGTKIAAFFETLGSRAFMLGVPVLLALAAAYLHRLPRAWLRHAVGPLVFVVLVGTTWVLWKPLQLPWAYRALWREPNNGMVAFTRSPEFEAGAMYRVLRIADGKQGLYQLIRHGGRLDSEFFPESVNIRSWPSPAAYGAFLRSRGVRYVMVWGGFDLVYRTNEHATLRRMADRTDCTVAPVTVATVEVTRVYQLFRVRPCP